MSIDDEDTTRGIFGGFFTRKKENKDFYLNPGICPDPYYVYAVSKASQKVLDIENFKILDNRFGDTLYSLVKELKDKNYEPIMKDLQSVCNSMKLDTDKLRMVKEGKYVQAKIRKTNLDLILDMLEERFRSVSCKITIADIITYLSDYESRAYYGDIPDGAVMETLNKRSGSYAFADINESKFTSVEAEDVVDEYHKAVLSEELRFGYQNGYYPLYKITEWIQDLFTEDLFDPLPNVYKVINQCKSYRWSQGLTYDWTYISYLDFLEGKHSVCFDVSQWNNKPQRDFISPQFIPQVIDNIKLNFTNLIKKRLENMFHEDEEGQKSFFETLFSSDFDNMLNEIDMCNAPIPFVGRKMYPEGKTPDYEKRRDNGKEVYDSEWFEARYGRKSVIDINFFKRYGDGNPCEQGSETSVDLPTKCMLNYRGTS